ncbi:ribonuclease H-like domain-containing protein, partial [Tanacetum coccineum]
MEILEKYCTKQEFQSGPSVLLLMLILLNHSGRQSNRDLEGIKGEDLMVIMAGVTAPTKIFITATVSNNAEKPKSVNDEEKEYEVKTVRPKTQTVQTRDDKSGQNSKKQGISFRKGPVCITGPSVSTARPVCTARPSVSTARPVCTAKPSVSTARPVYATRPIYLRMDNVRPRGSCSPIKRSYYIKPAFRPKDLKQDVKTFRVQNMTTAGTRAVVNTGKGKLNTDLKRSRWVWRPKGNYLDHVSKDSGSFMLKKGNPEILLQDHAVVDSGCSSHMTGNKAYLSDYEDFNGGFVAFGSDPKGGKITGKGKIKTANLDFDDVYFVDELKFNLFSVSQMCDKKNSVLFTESECLILSPSFKLLDESQVVLRAPRKDGMYSLDLKNIIPSRGITCLFANATVDESKLWHRRLGHVNSKNINKLVKGHLVRGLPSKVFFLATKLSTGRSSVSTATTPYVSIASTPTCVNAGESSFVYLRGKIPIDTSTLPNTDLPIDPTMPDLEDDSDAFSRKYAIGIHNLYDAEIYAGSATLGYVTEGDFVPSLPAMLVGAAVDQGEGSTQPTKPHHTPVDPIPSTSQPPIPSPPHPSPPHQSPPHSPPHPTPHSPPYPTPHSPPHLTPHSPPHSTPPYSPTRSYKAPLPEGNTSGSAEDSVQLKELMVLVPKLVNRIGSLEKELKETKQTLGNVVLTLVKKVKTLVSKAKSTDKGKRYRRRARSMAKNINTGLDAEDEINTGRVEINTGIEDVNTGSTKATHKSKEKIRQKEAGLEEAIRLQALMDEEVAKQIHLDKMVAKRVQEEQELSEQQLKRKAETAQDEFNNEREAFVKDRVKDASSELETKVDAIPTATKPPTIVSWKIISQSSQKAAYQIIRRDGFDKIYMSFGAILKAFSRDDLIELYNLVIKKYGANIPEEMYDIVLWGDLKTMFDPPLSDDAIWSFPLQQKIINWRYYPTCVVHCLTLDASTIYMLADRKYPLSKDACQV